MFQGISVFVLLIFFSSTIMANNYLEGNAFDSACIVFKKVI